MGSAALAAAVPYPGKATRISRKEQRSTKNMCIIKTCFVINFQSSQICCCFSSVPGCLNIGRVERASVSFSVLGGRSLGKTRHRLSAAGR